MQQCWRPSVIVLIVFLAASATGCQVLRAGVSARPDSAPSSMEDPRTVANGFAVVGDCLRDPPGGASKALVDCAQPHSAEVYGVFPMPFDSFPGDAAVKDFKAKCPQTAAKFVTPEEALDPSLHANNNFPDQESWNLGFRSVVCYVVFDAPRTGAFGAGRWIK